MTNEELLKYDAEHIWHPYTSMINPLKAYEVVSANSTKLTLEDGRELIDGMSSWWSTIHGYNNPRLNKAAECQLKKMAHVMFGGITHRPAVELAQKLIEITPEGLDRVFYSDSGSVSVEVAIKMALQYHHSRGSRFKRVIATFEGGYHGDTWHAMSVCDPVNGMHTLYNNRLTEQIFVKRPEIGFYDKWDNTTLESLERIFDNSHRQIAAFILEPIVQGAGGMRFYHPNYLKAVRELCNKYDVLLIADEIATGFGRSGKMFACEYADIIPDIMCVGKALTAGYMSFAATLTTKIIAEAISINEPHVFMHGPTFMGNPLACAIACENLSILKEKSPIEAVKNIEKIMIRELSKAKSSNNVSDVRVLGAIGVIELKRNVDMQKIQQQFVDRGVWVRPFGKLVYIMPPYIIPENELVKLCQVLVEVVDL